MNIIRKIILLLAIVFLGIGLFQVDYHNLSFDVNHSIYLVIISSILVIISSVLGIRLEKKKGY